MSHARLLYITWHIQLHNATIAQVLKYFWSLMIIQNYKFLENVWLQDYL